MISKENKTENLPVLLYFI